MTPKIILIVIILAIAAGFFFWQDRRETESAQFRKFTDSLNGYSLIYPIDWRAESDSANGWLWLFSPGAAFWSVNVQTSSFSSVEKAQRGLEEYLRSGGIKPAETKLGDEAAWAGFNPRREGIYQIMTRKDARTYVLEAKPIDGQLTAAEKEIIASFKFAPR